MSKVLLLGCGSRRDRMVKVAGRRDWTDQIVVTLDFARSHNPDIVHDLNKMPWPVETGEFDEVHAYEVLEHLGRQGDLESFFRNFYEIWRILKPYGKLAATVPRWDSIWAWGDPGHTRVISAGSLAFLSQRMYKEQVGVTPMADYRSWWSGDFELSWDNSTDHQYRFILTAIKPAQLL